MTVQPIAEYQPHLRRRTAVPFVWFLVCLTVFAGSLAVALGDAVVAPLTLIGALVASAALVDERTGRIPNRFCLAGFVTVVAAMPLVATQDQALGSVASSVVTGLLISGAPVLFLIWLVRPDLIGGGDWKLLAILGASLGLVSPIASALAAFVACLVQFIRLTFRRRRSIPFAPSLAVGYATALVAMPLLTTATGGAL